jgi:uncharacterized caspase-like protein
MAFSQGYALLVGVGEYVDPKLNKAVEITAKDAQSFYNVLTNASAAGYPTNQVHLITKGDATRSNILSALQELKGKTKEDSTVVIFLCGHGVEDKTTGKYSFLPREAQKKADGGYDQKTVVSEDELVNALKEIKHKKMLVVFNTCHSGHVAHLGEEEELESLGEAPSNATIDRVLNSGQGLYIISACLPEQRSWFIPNADNTFFMQFILEGLKGEGGIPNKKGYIGVFELYSHIYDKVSAKIKELGQQQDPVITVQKAVGAFPVALYKGGQGLANLSDSDLDQEPQVASLNPAAYRSVNVQAGRDAFVAEGNQTNVAGNQTIISGTQNNVTGPQFNAAVNAQNMNFGNQTTVQGDSISVSDNVNSGPGTQFNIGKVQGGVHSGNTYNTSNVNTGGGDYVNTGGGAFFKGGNINISSSGITQFGANSTASVHNYGSSASAESKISQLFSQLEQKVAGVSDPKVKRNAERALEDFSELRKPNADTVALDFEYMRSGFEKAGVLAIVQDILRQPEMSKYVSATAELTR